MAMSKTLQKEVIKKQLEDSDTVDLEAEIDSKLTLPENIESLKEKGVIRIPLEEIHQEDYVKDLMEKQLTSKLEEELKDLAKSSEMDLDRFYVDLKNSFELALNSKAFNLLIVSGSGGTGKTVQVKKYLAQKGIDFGYYCGHITPFQLYKILKDNPKKVIVLDDTNPILENSSSISLLMQSCDTRDVRVVMWNTSKGDESDRRFEMEGKIIIITNKSFEEIYEPLVTRSIKCIIDFDNATMIKIIAELSKGKPYGNRIVDLLKSNLTKMKLNLRIFKQLEESYKLAEIMKISFEQMSEFIIRLETDTNFRMVYDLLKSNTKVREALSEFVSETGKSRRTFYRIKQDIETGCIGRLL